MLLPETAAAFINGQIERLRHVKPKPRIVFPEGGDARVRTAADRLRGEGLVEPILLKPSAAIAGQDARKYARLHFERRRAKGITEVAASGVAAQRLYTAALLAASSEAAGSR